MRIGRSGALSPRHPASRNKRRAALAAEDRKRRGYLAASAFHTLYFGPSQGRLDGAYRRQRDFILQVENLLQFSVVSVGPKMRTGFGFEQLGKIRTRSPALRTAPSST